MWPCCACAAGLSDRGQIVRLFETVEGLDEVYLIMEYAAGGSLDAIIRIRGSLSEPEAQGVFVQVADGLQCVRGDGAVL